MCFNQFWEKAKIIFYSGKLHLSYGKKNPDWFSMFGLKKNLQERQRCLQIHTFPRSWYWPHNPFASLKSCYSSWLSLFATMSSGKGPICYPVLSHMQHKILSLNVEGSSCDNCVHFSLEIWMHTSPNRAQSLFQVYFCIISACPAEFDKWGALELLMGIWLCRIKLSGSLIIPIKHTKPRNGILLFPLQ